MKNKYYVLMSIIMMSLVSMSFASCSGGGDGGNNDEGGLGGGEWYMSGLYYTMDQLNQSMYDLFNGDWSNCPANCFDSDGKLLVSYQQPSTYEISLDGYLSKVTYAPMQLTTDGFKFIQIVNSNTLVFYFDGAIYKSDYQYGTKVYELEGNKYTGPLAVFANEPHYLTYTREGDYLNITVEGQVERIAVSGNSLIVDGIKFDKISTAKSMSTTNIVDNSSPNTNHNNLNNYSSCPDENHPHMIDLGLPSGTKWACCNIDANAPNQYGNRYAWGETTSKSEFNWGNYKYRYNSIGKEISGTQYDVAHEKWGGSWCMPTKDQFEELLNNTKSEWFVAPGDVIGRRFIGSNGNMIFLPLLHGEATGAFYWSSTNDVVQSSQSYKLRFSTDSRKVEINVSNHCDGNSIRPVQDNSSGGGTSVDPSGNTYIPLSDLLKRPMGVANLDMATTSFSDLAEALSKQYTLTEKTISEWWCNFEITTSANPECSKIHLEDIKSLSFNSLNIQGIPGSYIITSYTFVVKKSDYQDYSSSKFLNLVKTAYNQIGIPLIEETNNPAGVGECFYNDGERTYRVMMYDDVTDWRFVLSVHIHL